MYYEIAAIRYAGSTRDVLERLPLKFEVCSNGLEYIHRCSGPQGSFIVDVRDITNIAIALLHESFPQYNSLISVTSPNQKLARYVMTTLQIESDLHMDAVPEAFVRQITPLLLDAK